MPIDRSRYVSIPAPLYSAWVPASAGTTSYCRGPAFAFPLTVSSTRIKAIISIGFTR
jgi:hypothetical protein